MLRLAIVVTASACGTAPMAHAQLDAANAASARAVSVESPPVAPDLDEVLKRLAPAGRYIAAPVIGRIGVDVAPDGFEAMAERRSHLQGASAIVVEIESDSGSNAAAFRMARALQKINEVVPVIMIVRRAVGPAAMLLPAAQRVFILEPAPSGVLIALQPEADPIGETSVDEAIAHFKESLASLVEHSPRRAAIEQAIETTPGWQWGARDAYSSGVAEPLEGGMSALGRTLRIEPWTSSGRVVEDLLRRSTTYAQQFEDYRSRIIARAFTSLDSAASAMSQMAAAEQAAVAADPRHRAASNALRMQRVGDQWVVTPASAAAWQRSCEAGIVAWQRAAALGEVAAQHLRMASADIGSLVATATREGGNGVVGEAIDRLERERAEIQSRLNGVKKRCDAARSEADAIAALLKR